MATPNYALALYASIGLVGMGGALFGNAATATAGTMTAIAAGGAVHREARDSQAGFGGIAASLGLVPSGLWQGFTHLAGEQNIQATVRTVKAVIPDLGLSAAVVDEDGFITDARAVRSKWIIGQKGSLKTRLAVYLNGRILEAQPGTALIIGDPHWPSSEVDWMPGLDRDRFEEFHLKRTAQDIYQAVLGLQRTMLQRLESGDTNGNPIHMVIDEFVRGVYKPLPESQQQAMVDAIQDIQFQGRKVNVDVTCILHTAKHRECGLDSSVFINGDCYLMGTAGADSLQQKNLPSDFNWPKLLAERESTVPTVDNPKQVILYRDQDSGLASVELLPDPILQFDAPPSVQFEAVEVDTPAQWLDQHRDLIERLVRDEGIAPSTIAKRFSAELVRPDGKTLRRNKTKGEYSDPYYAALVEYHAAIQSEMTNDTQVCEGVML